jgi:hypothetical protein
MGLAGPEETILTNQVRTVAKNLVDATDVCASIGDLTTRIAGDSGKKNRLTTEQANQLLAIVGSVGFAVGCSGGGGEL